MSFAVPSPLKIAIAFMRSKIGFLPYIIIAALVGTVILRSHQLENTRQELKTEQTFRTEVGQILKAPDARPETVRAAARAVVKTADNQRETLVTIDHEATQAKKRADVADKELQRVQAENRRDFQAAQPVIRELETRKPTGNPVTDQKQLEEDSMSPWKGWKQ